MRIFKALVGISLLCLVAGDEPVVPGVAKTTTSTTVKPTSSTSKPTASTPPPKTTTTSTTTTPPPPPNTTTTAKPTTTPTTAPTTAKPTTPSPVGPVQGKWIANYTNTNRTCLVLEAAIQIDIPYQDGNVSKVFKVNVPPTANATGDCGANQEVMRLSFEPNNTITFEFNKTTDTKKFDLNSVMVTVNVTIPEKNISQFVTFVHNKHEFDTPLSNSYKCAKEQTLNLTGPLPTVVQGLLRISSLQVQAFRNSTNDKFDEALDCAGSETPDVVPIAVGCALAALVIIVLVAYLIGRRRSQARGYLSM